MKSENDRIIDVANEILEILKDEIPEIGAAAMVHLLASNTQHQKEEWLIELGKVWDHYHGEKGEKR